MADYKYSKKEIIKLIRPVALANGNFLNTEEYKRFKNEQMPSIITIIHYFGSWNQFCIEAGIEKRKRVSKIPKGMKRCIACGILFTPNSNRQIYHSRNCCDKVKRRKYLFKRLNEGRCPQCGGVWIRPEKTHRGLPIHCLKCQQKFKKYYKKED